MDDRELNQLLREWKAPDAPPFALRASAGKPTGTRWWQWLLTGSIRVPVPVGLAAVLLAALWIFSDAPASPPGSGPEPTFSAQAPQAPVVSLADFQPVEEVELRVVGELK